MSGDFRPHVGCRLFGVWALDAEPPVGWQRSGATPLIWRIATGEPADGAVKVIGYTETADCGVTNVKRGRRVPRGV